MRWECRVGHEFRYSELTVIEGARIELLDYRSALLVGASYLSTQQCIRDFFYGNLWELEASLEFSGIADTVSAIQNNLLAVL